LDFLLPLKAGRGVHTDYQALRSRVSHLTEDRVLRQDLDRIMPLVEDGSLLAAVEASVGPLA
jgi:histidine ammonia-lyase